MWLAPPLRGGGALVSVVGSEATYGHVSNALSFIGNKFSEWFKSSPQEIVQPQSQQGGQRAWETIRGGFESIWSTIKEFFVVWVKKLQQDLKDIGKFSPYEIQQQQQDVNIPNIDWKVFFNGLFILCHFSYRDVFQVKFGTLLHLLAGLLVDISKWEWNKKSFLEAFEKFNENRRFEKSLAGFLSILIQLDIVGKSMRKLKSLGDSSNGSFPFKYTNLIPINGRNIWWSTYAMKWVNLGGDEKEK
ncbi:hypothetical protein [Mycoplasma suis]|uniref:Uncharacterized protein n=1 Tax=Mycoplasma suis (strain Illinois) TaxID=768700 RepID=F0QRZ0_MYCSL|nr:hypothetical protein [Mycoplasma suis]ADX98260.1 hypothetical protein MSU_0735 [Mycoplasma suis str. Illinois]